MDHGRQARKTKHRRKAAKQRRRARRANAAPEMAIAPVAPVALNDAPAVVLPPLVSIAPPTISQRAPLGWWERRLVRPVLGLVGRLLHPAPAPRRLAPQQELPCDLFLAVGHGSVQLFARGSLDELTFFQRTSRSVRHDLEFITRRDSGAGAEEFEGFALLRLAADDDAPLPAWAALEARWSELRDAHGLLTLPRPVCAESGGFIDGRNRAVAGRRAQVDDVRRRISHAETLALLRTELSPTERIAWVERAFVAPPGPGLVVHRYYLSGARGDEVWLVRHTSSGKRLLRAEPSRHGLQVLVGERRRAA